MDQNIIDLFAKLLRIIILHNYSGRRLIHVTPCEEIFEYVSQTGHSTGSYLVPGATFPKSINKNAFEHSHQMITPFLISFGTSGADKLVL